uniref:CRAL-TRIO domain-containing protein n=3 Tax=Photinus pyralis TaxID=7054 RepID=A0A1Y1LY65_PHOPY
METAMKLLLMTLDAAIYDHPSTGLVMLFDMKGVGLLHLTRVRLKAVQVFCQYLQEALPVKLTEIHVLNTVNFLEKVLNILRPFVKTELFEKIKFHSTRLDMDEFHAKYVPRECLPADYGGELGPLEVLAEGNARRLLELETFFEAEENQQRRNII